MVSINRREIILRLKAIVLYISEHSVKLKVPVTFWLMIIQLAGAFAVLYGISFWSVPCAFIVGGLGAIAALEMQGKPGEAPEDPAEDQKIRAQIDAALARGHNPFDSQLVPMTSKWLTYVALVRRSKNAE